ncbi:uncharacterized protein LOC141850550 [Brevipalpus obovatus]|uniref:uncharacterized protein LOC141850550 n=1 Tax=Brevipalpus obovatus TaxID=246614 RepID=UPI003D9E52C6
MNSWTKIFRERGRFLTNKVKAPEGETWQNPMVSTASIAPEALARLMFPSHQRLMRFDKLDPKTWNLVYRNHFSTISTWGTGYSSLICFLAGLYYCVENRDVFFGFFREEDVVKDVRTFTNKDGATLSFEDSRSTGRGSWLVIALACIAGGLFFRSLSKVVSRGYYSPQREEFLLLRPNFLIPWKPRRIICKPGDACVDGPKSALALISHNTKINGLKLSVDESCFFSGAFYDVLLGYIPSEVVKNMKIDPAISFRDVMSPPK